MKKLIAFLLFAFFVQLNSAKADVPIGTIIAYTGSENQMKLLVNDDWMLCNGDSLDIRKYDDLFEVIGYIYGKPSNKRLFYLPDYRGLFLRGVNGDRSDSFSDPDTNSRKAVRLGGNDSNQVGSVQKDTFKIHNHTVDVPNFQGTSGLGFDGVGGVNKVESDSTGNSETRPKNAYVYWIIKVK